jgi:hypothetical protein
MRRISFTPPIDRFIVNGGKYQDFPYLHFHLISDLKPESFNVQPSTKT